MSNDNLEAQMAALAALWQQKLNDELLNANPDEQRNHVQAMLTVACGNLAQLLGSQATAESLELTAGVMRQMAAGLDAASGKIEPGKTQH